jgi:hypothetical protein
VAARAIFTVSSVRAPSGPGTGSANQARAAERPVAPGDETERFLYAVSVLHCLPVGRTETPSAATGTVLRPAAVDALAREAGFAGAEPLPVEHRFHRLYRLSG